TPACDQSTSAGKLTGSARLWVPLTACASLLATAPALASSQSGADQPATPSSKSNETGSPSCAAALPTPSVSTSTSGVNAASGRRQDRLRTRTGPPPSVIIEPPVRVSLSGSVTGRNLPETR